MTQPRTEEFGGPGNPQALRDYFNDGAAGRIDWGTEGDFMQCVEVASHHMSDEDAKGFCANRHYDATGHWSGEKNAHGLSARLDRVEAAVLALARASF